MTKSKIVVQQTEIAIIKKQEKDFISLTDIAKYRNQEEPFSIINNWMRNRSTIEFIGLWEKLNNPDFKPIDFERFRNEAGSNYFVYANEADMLNMALFGKTAKQWRDENPDAEGNIRDQASIEQLVVLSNLESINAVIIRQELLQNIRLEQLNQIAITQMKSLIGNKNLKKFI